MYSSRPNLIIGFHGCEKTEQEKLLHDSTYIKKSTQSYDWLGHGMYFWENNPERALHWAEQKQKAGTLKSPASIGSVLDLGYCLDLLSSKNIQFLKEMFELFQKESKALDNPIPSNKNHEKDPDNDKVLRYLDCAVIEYTHRFLKDNGEKAFDSVRAAFTEGKPIYPSAGFFEKTHIQICIINPNCIKGFFLPRKIDTKANEV